jgi:hypothetical protein
MMTMAEFVEGHGIEMRIEQVAENPAFENDEWSRSARHWLCTLVVGNRQMQTHFSQGSGIREQPEAEDVVNALALDAATYLNARDFEEWASELGHDTDSRRAERTYNLVGQQTRALERLLGRKALDELIGETEPL